MRSSWETGDVWGSKRTSAPPSGSGNRRGSVWELVGSWPPERQAESGSSGWAVGFGGSEVLPSFWFFTIRLLTVLKVQALGYEGPIENTA